MVEHLLPHCVVAKNFRNDFFAGVRLVWVMPRRVVDFLASWKGKQGNPQKAVIWKMAPYVYCGAFAGDQ